MISRFAQWLSLVGLVAAQAIPSDISPYNSTTHGDEPVKIILSTTDDSGWVYDLIPLKEAAYNRLPHMPNDQSYLNGSAVLATPGSDISVDTLISWDVAYTSCDAADYTDQRTMADVVSDAIRVNASAILFYSTQKMFCNLTDYDGFTDYAPLYSMVAGNSSNSYKSSDSSDFLYKITHGFVDNQAHIYSFISYTNHINQVKSNSSWLSLGGSGSTAVAMIILYSITGVITALFLLIIITGAIRAHRHPERYGPRNVLGRPRQSRAKGIARAMLDTIPIVKFGEQRTDEAKDVEDGRASPQSHELSNTRGSDAAEGTGANPPVLATTTIADPAITTTEKPIESSAPQASKSPTDDAAQTDDNLGCSICTEDFERGQDIRVLPCNHQFHPACVDPWLLDVSGTCPLCRIDLNPEASATTNDELPPPLDNSPVRYSRGAIFLRAMVMRSNVDHTGAPAGLQSTDREERLAALRRWRRSPDVNTQPTSSAAEAPTQTQAAATSNTDVAAEAQQEEVQRRSRLGALSRLVRRR